MKGEDYIRDVDYSDVFGGPPRQLWRRGKRVAEEEEEEETKDKPIFGGKSMVLRRHLHGDHFFDDIFGGDCSTWSWRTHPHHRSRYYQIVIFLCSFPLVDVFLGFHANVLYLSE